METVNAIAKMKELIASINLADKAYYGDDAPIMTDKEYDALTDELKSLEKETGIVFANSPSKRVGGVNKTELGKVRHTRPMLSAKKTKSVDDVVLFAEGKSVVLSWKLDGLSLILRYENGVFKQALTRGEDGLVGEDVTHTVKYLRNVPKTAGKGNFEVRGEGVISWADYRLLNKDSSSGHPRSLAAGLVRSLTPDKGRLSHVDFRAFELITDESRKTKEEELDALAAEGFAVVDRITVAASAKAGELKKAVAGFIPERYLYPADGIIAEYNDLKYGKSLGATSHHENRMLAYKWDDSEYETVFRGVELSATRNGAVSITALFDPVVIDGSRVSRADLHSLGNFEKYEFGVGDVIKVYKANMIIPQISENLTRSGNYKIPDRCPCCGAPLEVRTSSGGARNLYCPNPECIARNAQKLARFCDRDAMNIEGFNATVLEKLMAYGLVKTFADLYNLKNRRADMLLIPGVGYGVCDKLIDAVEASRAATLSGFLVAVGIPLMGAAAAREIDEYFLGSWDDFENAVKSNFSLFHIAGVSEALDRNIKSWYKDENEAKLWRPVLKEIRLMSRLKTSATAAGPFSGANIVITGTVNNMPRKTLTEILTLMGANVSDSVSGKTDYLIVGETPGSKKLADALKLGTKIITREQFLKMLTGAEE